MKLGERDVELKRESLFLLSGWVCLTGVNKLDCGEGVEEWVMKGNEEREAKDKGREKIGVLFYFSLIDISELCNGLLEGEGPS